MAEPKIYPLLNDVTETVVSREFSGKIKGFQRIMQFSDNGHFVYRDSEGIGIATLKEDGTILLRGSFIFSKFYHFSLIDCGKDSFVVFTAKEYSFGSTTPQTFSGLFSLDGKKLIENRYDDLFFSESEGVFYGGKKSLNGTKFDRYKFDENFNIILHDLDEPEDFYKKIRGKIIRPFIQGVDEIKYSIGKTVQEGYFPVTRHDRDNDVVCGKISISNIPTWFHNESSRVLFVYDGYICITNGLQRSFVLPNGLFVDELFISECLGIELNRYSYSGPTILGSKLYGKYAYRLTGTNSGEMVLKRLDLSSVLKSLKDFGNGIFEINEKKFLSPDYSQFSKIVNKKEDSLMLVDSKINSLGLVEVINETGDMIEIPGGSKFKKSILKMR